MQVSMTQHLEISRNLYLQQLLITLSQNKNIYNSTLSFVKKVLIETFFVFEPKSLTQTA